MILFCPVCKGEFRDGFTYCKKCGVDLVEDAPIDDESIENSNKIISKILAFKIEDYLKIGGIVFIIVAILKEGSNDFFSVVKNVELRSLVGWQLFGTVMMIVYSIVKDTLWGLFYIALGYIIGFLKRDEISEKNN
jgi:hypothetical protein